MAIAGSAVIGGAIGLYNNRQNNIDSLPPGEIPHNTPPFPNSNLLPELLKPEIFPSNSGLPWLGTTPPFPGSIDDGYSHVETFPGADCLDLFKPFFEVRGQRLKPDQNAQGEHTVIRRDKSTGEIIKYETFQPQSNPQNPNPWETLIRFDKYGPSHINRQTRQPVPTPHIQGPNIPGEVRPAQPNEIPK